MASGRTEDFHTRGIGVLAVCVVSDLAESLLGFEILALPLAGRKLPWEVLARVR